MSAKKDGPTKIGGFKNSKRIIGARFTYLIRRISYTSIICNDLDAIVN